MAEEENTSVNNDSMEAPIQSADNLVPETPEIQPTVLAGEVLVVEPTSASITSGDTLIKENTKVDQSPIENTITKNTQVQAESPTTQNPQNIVVNLLVKARNALQGKKRKKLDKIMTLFAKHNHITNDMVEKLLHTSDATATRYLSILEKENKITQAGHTGHAVSYIKI